ncbi:MAG TPA: hypothetical protein VF221_16740 [Chloroflexota bacterium]
MTAVQSENATGRSVQPGGQEESETQQRGLAVQVGPLEVDAPKAIGYYGGLGVALMLGLIEWPLGLFVAGVPFFKMLTRPNASQVQWAVGEVLEGASTPVGGSASPVIRVSNRGSGPKGPGPVLSWAFGPVRDVWMDAKRVAHQDGQS